MRRQGEAPASPWREMWLQRSARNLTAIQAAAAAAATTTTTDERSAAARLSHTLQAYGKHNFGKHD